MIRVVNTVNAASNSLLQYGAIGAVLAVMLALFTWSFRLILTRFLKAFDSIADKIADLSKGQAVHSTETGGNHRQVMTTLFNHHQALTEKLDTMKVRSRRQTG